ncbi:atp-dependent dna [Phytophthora cinnamomi]|uniref:atp-dependent dna n=1 Tax=Phytophthora cinnamomi TaxID=4785 RepID=UPI003559F369|nr:atp-dependent dna [Phytophthora cinnamomi]
MSVQERQQLWRNGAVKKPQDEAAERAKQQERERQETGFDRVFQEVFGEQQNEKKGGDEEELNSILSSGSAGTNMSSLGLSTVDAMGDKDKEMVVVDAKVSGKRKADPSDDEKEEEAWGFATNRNSEFTLDDFDAPSDSIDGGRDGVRDAGKAAEFERWKADDAQSAVSDNFVKLNMRKRFKGSSGRAKKRPAYLRARNENPLDEATGDNSTGIAPVVNANGTQQRKKEKSMLANDGVDFIEECLEALAKAEKVRGLSIQDVPKSNAPKQEAEPLEPPRCHHALVCQSLEVKKKNKNHGRRFFACPLGFDEGRCDFFLWEDDHVPLALQTLFTASSSGGAAESAAEAEAIECVPLDIEATEEEQREAMLTNLRLVFGHADFRPGQQWAISRVLRRKDTLLVLPTGAGKSLCYQFPALFLPGITLVISPLISLMNDQYESLPAPLKARSVCLSGSSGSDSNSSKARHAAFVRDLLADKLSLIFLSPEKALGAGMQALLALPRVRARLALVCVDEAHCVSEWSHHFRPSYLRLAEVFRHAQCVLCVTATASRRVVHDVLHQLRSRRQLQDQGGENESDMVLQMPWQRRNLALEVRSVRSNDERLRHLVQILPELSKGSSQSSKAGGGGVIVYVHQQRQTEELAALLREQLPNAWRTSGKVVAFHAGMAPEAKEKVRTGFARGRVRVVVATIAFGMGIDKKNVRAVVHFHMPSSVEGYVQQIGRAGRDGKSARALLYLLNEDAVHFRSLLFSTALHRDQLRRLLALVFQSQVNPTSVSKKHVVAVECSGRGQRAGSDLTLVSLERDWLERHLDLKAATLETFLTLLALETQREKDGELGLRVTLQPLSMSQCTLQLLDTQAKKLGPQSTVKLLLGAVQRKELANARVTHRKDGYLSSWVIDCHLHEVAQWYGRTTGANNNGEQSATLLAASDAQQAGETNAAAVAAATNERRLLQEMRAAQQTGQIQRFSLSQPAFQLQLSWRVDVSDEMKVEVVDRWTKLLYAKHEHLESRQLARLAHLYGALYAAALPAPSPTTTGRSGDDEEDEEDLEDKAHALETKLVRYFEDDDDKEDGDGVVDGNDIEGDDDERLLQKMLRPLTESLIDAIERDTRSLVQLRLGGSGPLEGSDEENKSNDEGVKWTSYAVAKVFHGLTTPQLPTRQWRDHVCWRRYSDVAFERIVQIAHKVILEEEAMESESLASSRVSTN